MKKPLVKKLLGIATEIAVMLFFVLLFFTILTTVLFSVFPSGISLTRMLEQNRKTPGSGDKDGSGVGAILDIGAGSIERAVATLSRTGNEVMSKNASSIAWSRARAGLTLRDHDAIQTFKASSAQINFDPRNFLVMGSNSLMILKRAEKSAAGSERRSAVVVVDGELQGRLASAPGNSFQLSITTPAAGVKMASSAANADFRISINPDHSSTVVVFSGEAQVSARGKTVRVGKNSGVTVRRGEAPGGAVHLLPPPVATGPAAGSLKRYRDLPTQVEFSWEPVAGSDGYRVQVARDHSFTQIVADARVDGTRFSQGNLKQGVYFWRVSSIAGGIEGERGKGRRLETLQDLVPPPLQVTFPEGAVPSGRFLLSGSTEPGCRLFVRGEGVETGAGGEFSCEVAVEPGRATLVTVEAVDQAGNVSYRSQYVQGRW